MKNKFKVHEIKRMLRVKLSQITVDKTIINDIIYSLITTSLKGIDTHGISQIKNIFNRYEFGRTQLRKRAKIIKQSSKHAFILVDGLNSPGQHGMMTASRSCKIKAKKFGIAFGIINNSTHFGACSPYIKYLADNGLLSIIGSNSTQSMIAFKSKKINLGNNPIGFGFPSKKENLIIDFSTAVLSFGKLNEMINKNVKIPKHAFVLKNKRSNQVYEISRSQNYAALPFGDYKGASIAMLIEVLSAVIGGGNFLKNAEIVKNRRFYGPSHFIIAIDPNKINKNAKLNIEKYIKELSQNKKLRIPGIKSLEIEKKRRKFGIYLNKEIRNFLKPLTK